MDANNISSLLSGVMSDPEMMSKLQGILSDPDAMKTISTAVSGMGVQNQKPKEEQPLISSNARHNSEAANRAALICALKPYLNEERRDKADKLLSLLNLLSVSGVLGKLKQGDK